MLDCHRASVSLAWGAVSELGKDLSKVWPGLKAARAHLPALAPTFCLLLFAGGTHRRCLEVRGWALAIHPIFWGVMLSADHMPPLGPTPFVIFLTILDGGSGYQGCPESDKDQTRVLSTNTWPLALLCAAQVSTAMEYSRTLPECVWVCVLKSREPYRVGGQGGDSGTAPGDLDLRA